MAREDLRVEEVKNKKDLSAFVRFPWKLYQGDPFWVPPLLREQIAKLIPSHPFLSHAEMILFLAKRGGEAVGRIAGIIDRHYVEYHQEKLGFFGFFESIRDPEVAHLLLSTVRAWLKDHQMEKMAGPMNPSTNDECGLLVDGFDAPPTLMMPYNPPYYPSLLEEDGMKKAMDLYTYHLDETLFSRDRLFRIADWVMKKEPLRVRSINLRRFDDDLRIVKEIYNDAWSKNWGFVPMTDEEINYLAKNLKPLVVPDLVILVHWNDEPVAFAVALPDYNQVLKHLNGKLGLLGMIKFLYYRRKITSVRIMLLGVKQAFQKKGIEGLLYVESLKRGIAKGYRMGEASWILENNVPMQRGIEAMGGKRQKTYRIYEMPV